jgi:hypothetical protein
MIFLMLPVVYMSFAFVKEKSTNATAITVRHPSHLILTMPVFL